MKKLFLVAMLWLGCTAAGVAQAASGWLAQPEVLNYTVNWGPLVLGRAALLYTPGPGASYAVEARVKDDSMWIDLEDKWRAEGVRSGNKWYPRVYTAKQKENDYRADKRVTFRGNTALYENLISSEPSLTVDLPPEARDVLSTLYGLRARGVDALHQQRMLQVMGLKDVFKLEIKPAVGEQMKNGVPEVWRVDMYVHIKDRMERWRVWLANNEALTPVKIEGRIKLGTFVAILRE